MFLFGNGRVLTQSDMDTINMHSIAYEGDEFILQYIRRMVLSRFRSGGLPGAIRAVKKWPRVKPHWARIRRRICHCCNEEADLSEPRYLVCSGCGEARYCSEACQRAHWAEHQKECPAGQPGWNAAEDVEALARRLQREWEEEDNRPRRVDSL